MAAAKKSSKKKSSKSKRANACARGGSEMRTIKGTSPRSVRRRSLAAFDLVTCRKARPVKAKKRAPKKRASVKNGAPATGVIGFRKGDRVKTHPATNRWAMGDRYGDVTVVSAKKGRVRVRLDRSGDSIWFYPRDIEVID